MREYTMWTRVEDRYYMKAGVIKLALYLGLFSFCWLPTATLAERHLSSGVQGQVVISQTIRIDGTILGGSPTHAHGKIYKVKGRLVAWFATDAQGHFKVALPSGNYIIVPDPLPYLGSVHTSVTVHKNEFTATTVGYYAPPL